MILVVSHENDDHASVVLGALARMGRGAELVDTAAYPASSSISQRFEAGESSATLAVGGRVIDFGTVGAVWWRRPQPFVLHDGLDPGVASFTYSECHEAVAGLWQCLDAAWVNPPGLDEAAQHKPYQLKTAVAVGLPVPRTLITNEPAAARRFAAKLGPERTVYKTFLATEDHWRETRLLRDEEVALLDRVALAPVIFQEYVPAVADLRVTVVGPQVFATAITAAPGGYQVDYRMDLDAARYEPTELDPVTEKGLVCLMERLGLVYGAIDLRRTPDGEEVFLEINPAGEFGFIEERTGQPIAEAVASFLVDLDSRRP